LGEADKKEARAEAKEACRLLLKHGKIDRPALTAAYRHQGTYEWLRGRRPNKAEKWWQKSLDHAAQLGARYEGAITMLEMGRRLDDRSWLERAEAEFADMGALYGLGEARRLLGVQAE
jgi:hypothetical protein